MTIISWYLRSYYKQEEDADVEPIPNDGLRGDAPWIKTEDSDDFYPMVMASWESMLNALVYVYPNENTWGLMYTIGGWLLSVLGGSIVFMILNVVVYLLGKAIRLAGMLIQWMWNMPLVVVVRKVCGVLFLWLYGMSEAERKDQIVKKEKEKERLHEAKLLKGLLKLWKGATHLDAQGKKVLSLLEELEKLQEQEREDEKRREEEEKNPLLGAIRELQ